MRTFAIALLVLCGLGADRPNLRGRVVSPDGRPIYGATVSIYTAGVRTGTSPYCPSCYADCGKSAVTDSAGNFAIESLDPELVFRVLVVAEGYKPAFVVRVDPSSGPIEAKLQHLPTDLDPKRMLLGRVIGPHGEPVVGASVFPKTFVRHVDPLSITNARGEFLLSGDQPLVPLALGVEARGLAPHVFEDVAMGDKPVQLQLGEGATVSGRLLLDGKPLGNVEIGLIQEDRRVPRCTGERTIGTSADGRFQLSNIGPPGIWHLYAHMTSLGNRGATHYKAVEVEGDGTSADAGDLIVGPAYTLSGRIVLSDGKPVPSGTRVHIGLEDTWDSQIVMADEKGRFTAIGIPAEDVTVGVIVKGYRLTKSNLSLNLLNMTFLEGKVDQNISNLAVLLEPGEIERPNFDQQLAEATGQLQKQPIQGAERNASDAFAAPQAMVVSPNPPTTEPIESIPANDIVPPEVRFAIQQSIATYESIENVAYKFQSHYQDARFSQDEIGTAKQSGSLDSEAIDAVQTTFEKTSTITQRFTAYSAPGNCGYWWHDEGTAAQYFYRDLHSLPDVAQTRIQISRPPHPEKCAFGNGNSFLWQTLALHLHSGHVWKLERMQRDGEPCLKLSWYQRLRDGGLTTLPSAVYYLNPAKGYEVTAFEARFMDGDLLRKREITIEDVTGHGTWYPVKVIDSYYAPRGPDYARRGPVADGDHVQPTWILETKVDHVVVNPHFSQLDFSVHALGLSKGLGVWQTDANGNGHWDWSGE
jgi:hypothetical protein